MFEISWGSWLEPSWEGGWLWYPFVIYMIIYVLTWYMILCLVWTRNNFYWYKLIPYLSMMRETLIEDTSQLFLIFWDTRVRNWDRGILRLRELWKIGYDPYLLPIGLEMLIPYLHRVREWCSHVWSFQSIPQLASYPQPRLVGNTTPRLDNDLRMYLGCTTQVDYDAGVLPHGYSGSSMGRSASKRISWDNPMWFQVEIELPDDIPG